MRHLVLEFEQQAEVVRLAGADQRFHPIQRFLAFVAREILASAGNGEADFRRVAMVRAARGANQRFSALPRVFTPEATEQCRFADNVGLDGRGSALPVQGIRDAASGHPRAAGEIPAQRAAFLFRDGDEVRSLQGAARRNDAGKVSEQLRRFRRLTRGQELADPVKLAVRQAEGQVGPGQRERSGQAARLAGDDGGHHQVERILPARFREAPVEVPVAPWWREIRLGAQFLEGGFQDLPAGLDIGKRRDALRERWVKQRRNAMAGRGVVEQPAEPAGFGIRVALQQQYPQGVGRLLIGKLAEPRFEALGGRGCVVHDRHGGLPPAACPQVGEAGSAQEAGVPARTVELAGRRVRG